MRKLLLAGLVSLALLGHANAQEVPCAEHRAIAQALSQRWGENSAAEGITETGELMEVFMSPNGTWTIVVTFPNGVSCIVASGHDFELLPPPHLGAGEASY